MNTLKKVILTIAFVITIAGSICGIVFGVKFYNTTPSKEAERIEILETENKQLNEDLIEVNNNLVLCRAELQQSNKEKETLQSQINDKNTIINQKNVEIEMLTNDCNSWQGTAEERQEKINELTAERAEAILERKSLLAQLAEKETNISNLQSQVLNLENEVTRLTGLLASYEYLANETFEVNFYNGDTLVTTKAVRNNTNLTEAQVPVLTDEKDIFLGWATSQDSAEVVTVAGQTVTADTTYYAVWTRRAEVKFVDSDNVMDNSFKVIGTNVVAPENPSKAGFEFLGWAKSQNGAIVTITEEMVTEDVTYYAVWAEKYVVTYLDGTTTLSTEEVVSGNKATFPTAPAKSGWTFDGWYRNGVKVNASNFKPTADTTLKAQYYKWNTLSTKASSNLANQSTYAVSGLNTGDTVRVTFNLSMNYYLDYDGNSFGKTVSGQVATSSWSTTFTGISPCSCSGYVSLSFSCTTTGQLVITKNAYATNYPDECHDHDCDEFTFSSLVITKVEVRQNLYTL